MKTIEDKLLDNSFVAPSGCWLWMLGKDRHGYGKVGVGGKTTLAHRASHQVFKGVIPDGLEIDHLCRVRNCINPAHLEAVSKRVNTMRGESWSAKNARKTHCCRGHVFSVENTYLYRGGRSCRACNALAQAAIAARRTQRLAA